MTKNRLGVFIVHDLQRTLDRSTLYFMQELKKQLSDLWILCWIDEGAFR
jgi:hypothetical protein